MLPAEAQEVSRISSARCTTSTVSIIVAVILADAINSRGVDRVATGRDSPAHAFSKAEHNVIATIEYVN